MGCCAAAFADDGAQPEVGAIFVQDPALFQQRQLELEQLMNSAGDKSEGLDSLLQDASRIAKMNDQCASISINDVMGEDCWAFYRVELPQFEERYMRITGEIRLGHMDMVRGLEDRKLQIDACVDALYGIAQSKDQFVNLDGGVFVEPLTKGFQANYDFTLRYEPQHRGQAFEIAQKWGETCREMVVRQNGEGFAPFFLERLDKLNADLAQNGSLAVYKTDTSEVGKPVIFMDISKPVRSAYYLNGVKLFHSRIGAGSAAQSHLSVAFSGDSVLVSGAETVTKFDGTVAQYKGAVDFPEKSEKLVGRWYWENQGNTDGVDFGPEQDADSLKAIEETPKVADAPASEKTVADAAPAKIPSAEKVDPVQEEKSRSVHPSLWVGLTGTLAPYANESAYGYGLEENDLFVMPDLAVAARAKFGFGEHAKGFLAVGGGAMLGFAVGDELEKVYLAPLAQFEIGYGNLGFRETAIFPIPGEDEDMWMQFRSGVFYAFGFFNVEVGYAIVTNVGNGAYLGFGLVF